LLDIAEGHLRSALDKLCDRSSKNLQEGLTQNVSDLIDQMRSDVRACLDTSQHATFRGLFENMQNHGKDVEVTLKQVCKESAYEIS
jgi:predicted component of type VI protein secretion system